ncbi:glycosyltransferase family 2 protein [Mumia sp. Pv 4-285]|uniref:glycosyltransferase family 2 protein n=1 Tax=Mumia qirimensis TaxID=3234852 RepID=UPI00351D514C
MPGCAAGPGERWSSCCATADRAGVLRPDRSRASTWWVVDVGGAGWWERVRGGLPWGGPRVSVVVPVFEPGSNIVPLLASLDAQSLGRRAVELVFVDDGSRDGETLGWLRARAAERSNMVVVSIPGSGWPGRPRNVGLERARGEYVFFSDQDDELFPEALERMVAMADRNGSDVVAGKVVRVGGGTPYWGLAGGDVERADLVGDGVMQSRTVHKLFRRSFLVEHGIRFLEGRVRLEDHHFMGQVFGCSPVVSVLASSPCYRWVRRRDGTNNSSKAVDPDWYWGYYTAALDVADERGADPHVSRELRREGAQQCFSRTFINRFERRPPATRHTYFASTVAFVRRTFGEEVDRDLSVLRRLRFQTLRAEDEPAFLAVCQALSSLERHVDVEEVGWSGTALDVRLQVQVRSDDDRITVAQEPDRATAVIAAPSGVISAALGQHDAPWGSLSVRSVQSGIEWPVECRSVAVQPGAGDGWLQSIRIEARVQPFVGFVGPALEPGTWRLQVRSSFLGEPAVQAVPLDPDVHAEVLAQRVEERDGADVVRARLTRSSASSAMLRVRRPGRASASDGQ